MKIHAKVMSLQGVMALFILATAITFHFLSLSLRDDYESLEHQTVPELRLLEAVHVAGVGIFASTNRILVIKHILDHPEMTGGMTHALPDSPFDLAHEQLELADQIAEFQERLTRYAAMVTEHDSVERAIAGEIATAGASLVRLSGAMLARLMVPSQVATLQRLDIQFEEAKHILNAAVQRAMEHEMAEVREKTGHLERSLTALRNQSWGAGMLLIGIGTLLGLILSRSIIRPLQSLARAASRVGRGAFDVDVEVAENRNDEIGALTRAFRQMVAQRREAERSMRRAKELAEQASHAKSTFLAHMSHEIRTPMNTILGMGELLRDSPLSGEQRQRLRVLNRAGEGLLSLINDILDISKIEAGQLDLENAPFSLPEVVEGVREIMHPLAERKGITLSCTVETGLARRVVGDGQRLRQVLLNLTGNAIKFTERGGVSVTVTRGAGEGVAFSVTDSGPGIPEERQAVVFDAFIQADASTTRRHGGTGLGLAICRELVQAMGGSIQLHSRPDHGSTFRFTLPLPEEAAAAADAPALRQPRSNATPPAHRQHSSGLSILLVDDAEDNRLLLQAFLSGGGHTLQEAVHGEQALTLYREQRFDVVLMDIQMPVMDGYTAASHIRAWEAQRNLPRTPIIALTAHALKEDAERARQAGCDMHLTKPIRKQRLLEALAGLAPQAAEPLQEPA